MGFSGVWVGLVALGVLEFGDVLLKGLYDVFLLKHSLDFLLGFIV